MLASGRHISFTGKLRMALKTVCRRYVKGKLPVNKPSTIGVEFATKNVELKDGHGVVKAQIWDTGTLNPSS